MAPLRKIIECVVRQGTPDRLGLLFQKDRKVAAQGSLHVLTVQIGDIAGGERLFGNGCLCDDARLFYQGSRLVTGVTIVNNDFLDAHKELVDAFLTEHEASILYTQKEPDAAAAFATMPAFSIRAAAASGSFCV